MSMPKRFFVMLAALAILGLAVMPALAQEQVVKITAKKYEFTPNEVIVKKGVPVVLQLTSLDRLHGFNCPGLKLREDMNPGKVSTVRFTPGQAGEFPFHCDIFCGLGHEMMRGKIIVTE